MEEPSVGIQKADENVLASRPYVRDWSNCFPMSDFRRMRALPKRSAFAAAPAPSIMAGTTGKTEVCEV